MLRDSWYTLYMCDACENKWLLEVSALSMSVYTVMSCAQKANIDVGVVKDDREERATIGLMSPMHYEVRCHK